MSRSKIFRTFALAVACALSMTAPAVADTPKTVNVVAGNLADALETLAKQCGVDVIYPSSQLKGLTTEGVSGVLETRAAFQELLRGTRLVIKEEGGAVLITLPVKTSADISQAGPIRLAQSEMEQTQKVENKNYSDSSKSSASKVDQEMANQLEEITVTGSRLKHGDSSAVLTVFDRKKIDELGVTSVANVLAYLPQQPFTDLSESWIVGAARFAQLRGLNVDNTLVMINGRRAFPSASQGNITRSS